MLAAALIGFASGARTFLAVALTAWAVSFGWVDTGGTIFDWLGAPALAAVLTLLALGELYGDKQPDIGDRTRWPAVIARMATGGVAAGAIAAGMGQALLGLVIGALAAAMATFVTFRMRAALTKWMGKDLPAALVEDAATLLVAVGAISIVAS